MLCRPSATQTRRFKSPEKIPGNPLSRNARPPGIFLKFRLVLQILINFCCFSAAFSQIVIRLFSTSGRHSKSPPKSLKEKSKPEKNSFEDFLKRKMLSTEMKMKISISHDGNR